MFVESKILIPFPFILSQPKEPLRHCKSTTQRIITSKRWGNKMTEKCLLSGSRKYLCCFSRFLIMDARQTISAMLLKPPPTPLSHVKDWSGKKTMCTHFAHLYKTSLPMLDERRAFFLHLTCERSGKINRSKNRRFFPFHILPFFMTESEC